MSVGTMQAQHETNYQLKNLIQVVEHMHIMQIKKQLRWKLFVNRLLFRSTLKKLNFQCRDFIYENLYLDNEFYSITVTDSITAVAIKIKITEDFITKEYKFKIFKNYKKALNKILEYLA